MARITAILKALSKVISRDQKSIWALVGNNFFISCAIVMQDAGGFIYLLIGLVILFPLSTDPLAKVPPSRLSLWPLDRRERTLLRVLSPFVNPMTWALIVLVIATARGKVSWPLAAAGVGLVTIGFLLPPGRPWRPVPHFPGPLNQLIRKNLRGILSTLDVYVAVLLSASVVVFRVMTPALPREAMLIMTILIVVAMSSFAQSLFGLDGAGGTSRYRLLPLAGWQLLAAKDLAYLLIVTPLTLTAAPLAGIGATMMALAIGHRNSVLKPKRQLRWRFSSGGVFFMDGLTQVAGIAMTASSIYLYSPWLVIVAAAALAASLWWFGRTIDAQASNN